MIDNRLKTIANLVDDNSRIIDIGCDHALLDIFIAKNKNITKIIASDINAGPLEQANKNVTKEHLEKRIILKQGNGLEVIEDDIDTIVVSGLGGNTIIAILDVKRMQNIDTLILAPNNKEDKVRYYLKKIGYRIVNEELVLENDIIYVIFKAIKGNNYCNKKELKYGTNLIKNKELYNDYLLNQIANLERILKHIPKKYIFKRIRIKKEIIDIKHII